VGGDKSTFSPEGAFLPNEGARSENSLLEGMFGKDPIPAIRGKKAEGKTKERHTSSRGRKDNIREGPIIHGLRDGTYFRRGKITTLLLIERKSARGKILLPRKSRATFRREKNKRESSSSGGEDLPILSPLRRFFYPQGGNEPLQWKEVLDSGNLSSLESH